MQAYQVTSLESTGFFADLFLMLSLAEEDLPDFLDSVDVATLLDRYYYFVRSGDKLLSKIVRSCYDEVHHSLTNDGRKFIAESFWQIFKDQLLRQWENYKVQYNPVQPYDVHEETDYTHGNTSTIEDDGSITFKKEGKEATEITDDNRHNYVYGFDSTSGENGGVDDTRSTHSSTATIEYGADSTVRQDTKTLDTLKTSRDNSTDDLDTHKYGTLGTTSIGELMGKEFETWIWNFYNMVLFPAVDKMLTIPIY